MANSANGPSHEAMSVTQLSGGLGNRLFQHALVGKLGGASAGKVGWNLHPLTVHVKPRRRLFLDQFKKGWAVSYWVDVWRPSAPDYVARLLLPMIPIILLQMNLLFQAQAMLASLP